MDANEKKSYEKIMRRCLKLAKKGEGLVSPNPLVGAVVFDDDFNIVSEGAHEKFGENHAERNAILNSKIGVKGMNIAVNLEPCSHFGKTPPCADLIIKSGIKKVVAGMQDPNPLVAGKGFKKLKEAGIEVITGILEKECFEANKIFIKNQTENKPYIMIKTAVTLDGKIAAKGKKPERITCARSIKEVHALRNKYDAVLTSSETVINDDPQLTCRLKNGRNPVRIIVDTMLKTSEKSRVYADNGAKVYLLASRDVVLKNKKKYGKNTEIVPCPVKDGHVDIKYAICIMYEKGIKSIMVEAGGRMNNAFVRAGEADELIMFIAPKILCDSEAIPFIYGETRDKIADCNNLKPVTMKRMNNDIMLVLKFEKNGGSIE